MNSKEDKKEEILSSSIVDVSFLREHLSSDLDQLSQMIVLFLNQTPDKINALKDNLSKEDYPSIKANAHFLKSSFTIMGLHCKDILSEIELLCSESKEIEKITTLANSVVLNFNESVVEYERILKNIQSKMAQ